MLWKRFRFIKSFRFLLIFYILNIVVFAWVYHLYWIRHSDYFIIDQDVNLYPIQLLEVTWQLSDPVELDFQSGESLSELYAISKEKIDQYHELNQQYQELQEQLDENEAHISEIIDRRNTQAEQNFQEYLSQEIGDFIVQEELLQSGIEAINLVISDTKESLLVSQLQRQAGELETQRLEIEIERLTREGQIHEEYLNNIAKFTENELSEELELASQQEDATYEALREVQTDLAELRGDIYDTFLGMSDNRTAQLEFIDLLYFSLSVSTANTFGDILPNHTTVRTAVMIQLLINLLIVSVLLTVLTERLTKNMVVE